LNIYLLTHDSTLLYDVATGFVVRAPTPKAARQLASKNAGDEGASAWIDYATCKKVGVATRNTKGIILRSFSAG